MDEFEKQKIKRVNAYKNKKNLIQSSKNFFLQSVKNHYSYNFSWLGAPIIQYPQDILSLQEIIFKSKPNIIIETGIARGGSLIFLSSLLSLVKLEFKSRGIKKNFKVLSIDIDIRKHTKNLLRNHFLKNFYKTYNSSSTSLDSLKFVKSMIKKNDKVMLILDSNHTENHVLQELKMYGPLVSKNCYCIVFDTIIDFLPNKLNANRNWKKNNSPYTAVRKYIKYLKINNASKMKKSNKIFFDYDYYYQNRSLLTNMPFGCLIRK